MIRKILPFLGVTLMSMPLNSLDFNTVARNIAILNYQTEAAYNSAQSELLTLKSENNLPDPEIGFDYKWGKDGIGNKLGISLSQSFDWPGVYASRSNAARKMSLAVESDKERTIIDKALEIKSALIEVVAARKEFDIISDISNNLELIYEATKKSVEQRQMTVLDLKKIELERVQFNQKKQDCQNRLSSAISNLYTLNNGKSCPEIVDKLVCYPDDHLYPLDIYLEAIDSKSPDKKYYDLIVEAKAELETAARRNRFPGFSIGYVHEAEMGDYFNGFTVAMTLPILSSRHKSKAAKLSRISVEEESRYAILELSAQIENDYNQAISMAETMSSYKTILDTSDIMELLKKAYNGGEMTLTEYLTEVNYFTEALQKYNEVASQYHLILSRLNRYDLFETGR